MMTWWAMASKNGRVHFFSSYHRKMWSVFKYDDNIIEVNIYILWFQVRGNKHSVERMIKFHEFSPFSWFIQCKVDLLNLPATITVVMEFLQCYPKKASLHVSNWWAVWELGEKLYHQLKSQYNLLPVSKHMVFFYWKWCRKSYRIEVFRMEFGFSIIVAKMPDKN